MKNNIIKKVFIILNENLKQLQVVFILSFLLGLSFCAFIYKPQYSSVSNVVIESAKSNKSKKELLLIFKNKVLMNDIYKKSPDFVKKNTGKNIEKNLKLSFFSNSNILNIKATTDSYKASKALNNLYLKELSNTFDELQNKELDKIISNIELSINKSTIRHNIAAKKLENFLTSIDSYDLDEEINLNKTLIKENNIDLNEIIKKEEGIKNSILSLKKIINIKDEKQILTALYKGYNSEYKKQSENIEKIDLELTLLKSKYTNEHPKVKQVKLQKAAIQKKMKELASENVMNADFIPVNNPVSIEIIKKILLQKAELSLISATKNTLKKQIKTEKANLKNLRQYSGKYNELKELKLKYNNILKTLKKELFKVLAQKASISSKISILPGAQIETKEFPGRFTVLFSITLAGVIAFIAYLLSKDYLQSRKIIKSAQIFEKEFNAPILGSIPWLNNNIYDNLNNITLKDEIPNYYSISYQNVISNLLAKSRNESINTIALTSSEHSKSRSTVLLNIAFGLQKAGCSVLVIDADFRTPTVASEMKVSINDQSTLPNLLDNMKIQLAEKNTYDKEIIRNYTQAVEGFKNLHFIFNSEKVKDPYAYVNSKVLSVLIKDLKHQYDWIIIDTPPVISVPDVVSISSYTDGVVITAGMNTTKENLEKVSKTLKNNYIPVLGIVSREKEIKEENMDTYMKQMLAKVIPQDKDLSS